MNNYFNFYIPYFNTEYGSDWTDFITLTDDNVDYLMEKTYQLYWLYNPDYLSLRAAEIILDSLGIPYTVSDTLVIKKLKIRQFLSSTAYKGLGDLYLDLAEEIVGIRGTIYVGTEGGTSTWGGTWRGIESGVASESPSSSVSDSPSSSVSSSPSSSPSSSVSDSPSSSVSDSPSVSPSSSVSDSPSSSPSSSPSHTYDDWYLPSKDELSKMYVNLKSGTDEAFNSYTPVGDFAEAIYWSSSEFDAENSWYQGFEGSGNGGSSKTSTWHVRPIRSFTSVSPSYALRDTGPAGGLICYKNGNDYLEAATEDVSSGMAWSNITDSAVTGTDTAIGTGLSNSTAIIGQISHSSSAAKECLDYSIYTG